VNPQLKGEKAVDHRKVAAQYVAKIRTSYLKTVRSILDTATLLLEARAKVPHGMFERMFHDHKQPIRNPLPFSHNTANRLMAIGKRFKGLKSATLQTLPASYAALYELSHLPARVLTRLAKQGTINGDLTVQEVQKIVATHRPPRQAESAPPERLPYVYQVLVMCKDEAHQTELLERFEKEGFTVKALIT
jgi:hypothetical protein